MPGPTYGRSVRRTSLRPYVPTSLRPYVLRPRPSRFSGMRLTSGLLGIAVLLPAIASGQTPATFDSAFLSGFKWRNIGPDRGGRSIAVSGVKGRPNEAYFGATGGGLWKTTDGGESWKPVTDGQIRSASVGAIGVSESNPDIVYIGTGESCIRGNIMPG